MTGRPTVDLGMPRRHSLSAEIERVLRNDNCSGCGACSGLNGGIAMHLDSFGFLRPKWSGELTATPGSAAAFRGICPGVAVRAPTGGAQHADALGPFVSIWSGHAVDPELRFAGSSGGILSALTQWLLDNGTACEVVGAVQATDGSTRTTAGSINDRDGVLAAAGSRYAPYAAAAHYRPETSVFVGKPCEAYAVRRMSAITSPGEPPLLLSFFCAGVPSQNATDELVVDLGVDPEQVTELRYRGQGWPGRFRVVDRAGRQAEMTYEQSWGLHLGRRLQGRCRICPDGTGEHADISVGDHWDVDGQGFPRFEDGQGVSAVVARTARGHEVLEKARAEGVLRLDAVDAQDVVAGQPFQARRRETLLGRLIGRRLAGKRMPHYSGHGGLANLLRHPRLNLTYLRGSYRRAAAEPRQG